jgi:exopolysaccharide production protein ExoZ
MFLSLQTYRGLAAISVAAFHLSIAIGDERYLGYPVFDWFTWRMGLGVDFFFVLSGFIIVMAHEKDIGERSSLRNYCERRFARIYPIYWIYVGILCSLLALGFGSVAENPDTLAKWLSTIMLVRFENFIPPIAPAWTLFHEVAFYGVFSLLILRRKLGSAIFVGWQLVCLMLFQFPSPSERTPFATYFSAYNLEFAIGMLAYYIFSRRIMRVPLLWFGGSLALFSLTLLLDAKGHAVTIFPLLYALSFGGIILASVIVEADRPRLRVPILPFLGNASYSIYLTHEIAEGLMLRIAMKVNGIMPIDAYIIYIAALVGAVVAGCIAHIMIERPAIALTKRGFEKLYRKRHSVHGLEFPSGNFTWQDTSASSARKRQEGQTRR